MCCRRRHLLLLRCCVSCRSIAWREGKPRWRWSHGVQRLHCIHGSRIRSTPLWLHSHMCEHSRTTFILRRFLQQNQLWKTPHQQKKELYRRKLPRHELVYSFCSSSCFPGLIKDMIPQSFWENAAIHVAIIESAYRLICQASLDTRSLVPHPHRAL